MNGYLDCEEIIDPVVPFAESAEAYMRYVDQHPEKVSKWVFKYKEENNEIRYARSSIFPKRHFRKI